MSGDVRPPTVERAEGPDRPQSVIQPLDRRLRSTGGGPCEDCSQGRHSDDVLLFPKQEANLTYTLWFYNTRARKEGKE